MSKQRHNATPLHDSSMEPQPVAPEASIEDAPDATAAELETAPTPPARAFATGGLVVGIGGRRCEFSHGDELPELVLVLLEEGKHFTRG